MLYTMKEGYKKCSSPEKRAFKLIQPREVWRNFTEVVTFRLGFKRQAELCQ